MEMMKLLEDQDQKDRPSHIQNHPKEDENAGLFQEGHHIWTFVQDKVSTKKEYSCEDVRIQLKKALLEIQNGSKEEPASKKKSYLYFPLMAQAISKDKKKDQILVRFVGTRKFQITKNNQKLFQLDTIQPRVQIDFTNIGSLNLQIKALQERKDLEVIYFLAEIIPRDQNENENEEKKFFQRNLQKEAQNLVRFKVLEEQTYILNQIQRKEWLKKQNPIPSSAMVTVNRSSERKFFEEDSVKMAFDFEKEQLEKSKAMEILLSFDQKLKLKVQSGSIGFQRKKVTKTSNDIRDSKEKPFGESFQNFFGSLKTLGKKKEEQLKKIRNSSNLIYNLPHLQRKKQFLMVLVHLPDQVTMESLNFIHRQLLKARLLSIQGKVHMKAQRSLKE